MPFAKGNTLWKEGLKARKEKTDKINEFFTIFANGGMEQYANLLDKEAMGEELTKPEIDFMDRMQFWAEFVRPKLARTEQTGKDGGPITVNVVTFKKDAQV